MKWLHPAGSDVKAMGTWVAGLGRGGNRLPVGGEMPGSAVPPWCLAAPEASGPILLLLWEMSRL